MVNLLLFVAIISHLFVIIFVLKYILLISEYLAVLAKNYNRESHGLTQIMANDKPNTKGKSDLEQSNIQTVGHDFNEEDFSSKFSKSIKTTVPFGEDVIE